MYFINQKVTTPYGEGIYLGLSDNPEIIKVQPTTWTMARETKPTFFMNPKDVKPLYSIGTPVFLTYGNGTIIEYRESDNMYTVELLNWRLAQGQSPSLYLQECSLSTVPIIISKAKEDSLAVEDIPKPPGPSYADTCITNAIVIKEEAGTFYKKMDYQTAKEKYLKALEAIQYLGEGLTNKQKAIVFEQTVPCHNNISLCCMQLKNYAESALFAKNGIMLISALEERMEEGQVWKCLLERGMTKNKLIKEWKIKSYFLAGKAELLRKEYDSSMSHIESALRLLEGDINATAEITKLKDLLSTATKKKSAELKKEKSTWSKAFQKNKEEPELTPVVPEEEVGVLENVKTIEEILKGIQYTQESSGSGSVSGSQTKTKSTNSTPIKEKKIRKNGVTKNGKKVSKSTSSRVDNDEENEEEEEVEEGEELEDGIEENEGETDNDNSDSVSDETFGWLVGASAVLGVVGIAAFVMMKLRQK